MKNAWRNISISATLKAFCLFTRSCIIGRSTATSVWIYPLFPNYVFVHIAPPQRTSVLAVHGVLGMVGRGHVASALPDAEIASLRTGVQLRRFEPHPYLVAGERVRIKFGAMEGMEGILLRRKNGLRVVLTLDLIERSVAVEVDAEDVEPVGRRRV